MVAHPIGSDDRTPMTEEEYLAFADEQDIKYEYRGGVIYAMTGGTVRHGVITANTIGHLIGQLRDSDCSVTSPDVRVQIINKDAYRYSDVTVFCGDPAYVEGRTDTITNPALLVEVLSPRTATTDRDQKLEEYTQFESLQAYILVSQEEPKVEVFQRQSADGWLYSYVTELDGVLEVPLAGSLQLSEIYRRVDWEEATPPQGTDADTPQD